MIYAKGAVVRKPEVSGFELNDKQLADAVVAGLDKQKVEVPLQEAPKHVPDAELDKIKEIVSEYSTHFPSYRRAATPISGSPRRS